MEGGTHPLTATGSGESVLWAGTGPVFVGLPLSRGRPRRLGLPDDPRRRDVSLKVM